MIRKFFGDTEEEQFRYLKPRLIALGIGIAMLLLGVLLMQLGISFGETIGSLGTGIIVIDMLIFGWAIMRGLFGFATVGALFTNDIRWGIILFILFGLVGYLGGIFVAFVGICRFLVLLKKRKGNA